MMNVNAYQSNALAYGWFSINMQHFVVLTPWPNPI